MTSIRIRSLALAVALSGLAASAFAAAGAVPVVVAADTPVLSHVAVTGAGTAVFNTALYTVPAGKMLIVDSLSLVAAPLGASPALVATLVQYDAGNNLLSVNGITAPAGSPPAATQLLRTPVQAGGRLVVNVFSASGAVNAFVDMTGHLVDAP